MLSRRIVYGLIIWLAALLLFVLTSAASAEYVLWYQYTRIGFDPMNHPVPSNAPSEWTLVDTFENMAVCKASEISYAAAMAEILNSPVLNGRQDWSAAAQGSHVWARWIVTGVFARPNKYLTISYQCLPDTMYPRGPSDPGPLN